ncbi:YbaK/EbsC family protein [Nocardia terpenica]|uniref:YbaK/aminoacyl-tRNA synthetase-associated domain-containing protein n=1 Tax=Nocardia terpenica TaxID=455432 RepID=A0A164KQR9_9NOCA|nr:YbaK/EbsC family protein [Nocardia terpenica]KZM71636.1 hypothetical protein AWN90_02615 [Nocardia terpenica]NQE90855.1 YbaK/prolyl-tRNA synthetase associated domain-containing protein [Nocardia terpenica]
METQNNTYRKLIQLLKYHRARYRIIDHEPEGVTAIASELRGHALAAAAKSIVVAVKQKSAAPAHVLAVVSGVDRVDFESIRRMYGGTRAYFAPVTTAEDLAGSVSGTVLPFTFTDQMELIVDHNLLTHEEIFFNAARLDRSLALDTVDYQKIANPRIESIAQSG